MNSPLLQTVRKQILDSPTVFLKTYFRVAIDFYVYHTGYDGSTKQFELFSQLRIILHNNINSSQGIDIAWHPIFN